MDYCVAHLVGWSLKELNAREENQLQSIVVVVGGAGAVMKGETKTKRSSIVKMIYFHQINQFDNFNSLGILQFIFFELHVRVFVRECFHAALNAQIPKTQQQQQHEK